MKFPETHLIDLVEPAHCQQSYRFFDNWLQSRSGNQITEDTPVELLKTNSFGISVSLKLHLPGGAELRDEQLGGEVPLHRQVGRRVARGQLTKPRHTSRVMLMFLTLV